MSVPAAYLAIIAIWSTTPLAVKWSGEGPGFLFGALGRMALAAAICLALVAVLRVRLPWHKPARRTYLAGTLGAYGALLCVYWGAQQIPSGMVAILFGLTPLLTGMLARLVLGERSLTLGKLGGMLLGLAGLALIFGSGFELGGRAVAGIEVVLLGVLLHSAATVLIKRIDAELPGIAVTTGTLLLAVPLFLVTWLAFDGARPAALPAQALWSIVYLGVIASALGFTLYFYVLRHIEATAVALVTLVSPVLALILGATVNHESIGPKVWAGAALVLSGLIAHQWGTRLRAVVARRARV